MYFRAPAPPRASPKETDKQHSGAVGTEDDDDDGEESETDPETLQELRALFDLYDVDRSGTCFYRHFMSHCLQQRM